MSRAVEPEGGTAEEGARGAPSPLLHGFRVLESFTIAEPVLGVTEIARRIGLHKSTVSRILATLEQAGYVERDPVGGRFRLGLGLIGLAQFFPLFFFFALNLLQRGARGIPIAGYWNEASKDTSIFEGIFF